MIGAYLPPVPPSLDDLTDELNFSGIGYSKLFR